MVRTFSPKPNSIDRVNVLEVICLLMSGKPVNFSRYILKYISNVNSVGHPGPLPYANLLTLIFQHFGVFLEMRFEKFALFLSLTFTRLSLSNSFQLSQVLGNS